MLGYPRAPPLSASWMQEEGVTELARSQVAAMSRLLMLGTQPGMLCKQAGLVLKRKGGFLRGFLWPFLGFLTFCTTLGLG
jgi:hypothetical protein